MFLNDETSDKPKEDRIVKFKDEVIPERGRSRAKKPSEKSGKAVGASILKDSSKSTKPNEANNKPELKPVIKSAKKSKAPAPPPAVLSVAPPTETDISKQTVESQPPTIAPIEETTEKDKEESGYDSDQTLATLSAKDSASEASSLNSPASLIKNKQVEPKKDCDSDVEQDLSLDSIVTQNQLIKGPGMTPSEQVILRTTQPPPSLVVTSSIDKIEAQFCSLDPTLLENVTSVEVDWLKSEQLQIPQITDNQDNTEEDEELKALCDEERSSVASSIPMDFGDSLPPTLTNLIHKQFSLYR